MKKCIKNGLVLICAVIVMGFSLSAEAATGVTVGNAVTVASTPALNGAYFDVKVTNISKTQDMKQTRFFFEPVSMVNPQNINHWKIRVYCEDSVSVSVNDLNTNSCGKAVKIEKGEMDKFYVTLANPTEKQIAFSFKLKAYDANGKWLHTEREGFRWKQGAKRILIEYMLDKTAFKFIVAFVFVIFLSFVVVVVAHYLYS